MTKPVSRPRRKPGRKPLPVPRRQKHLYMTDDCVTRVKAWVADERATASVSYSFSDAIHDMVDLASFYYSERNAAHKLTPLSSVLGELWRGRWVPWIRIEPNGGRTVRCTRCKTTTHIPARRFSGIMRALGNFMRQHRDC